MGTKWTPEQRKAASERAKAAMAAEKAARDALLNETEKGTQPSPLAENTTSHNVDIGVQPEQIAEDYNIDELMRQMREMKENMDLMRAVMLKGADTSRETPKMDRQGDLVGEWEKYLVDPAAYPNPTERLKSEPRLKPIAFDYNYEMDYEVGVSAYQTKTGRNIREPKFQITLNRIVMDDQGNPTNKRYIARKLVFHEDPQAAIVIARDNNIEVNEQDERLFLNEMRYLRVRDWLFDIFWPKPIDEKAQIRDEVIGGTVVQVFTKNSVNTSEIDFGSISKKLIA